VVLNIKANGDFRGITLLDHSMVDKKGEYSLLEHNDF
jgi:hypothetical protein